MARGPKQVRPRDDGLGLSAELVIDGIRAAYNRWIRSSKPQDFRSAEPGPFLFNFMDYLTLAVPPGCKTALFTEDHVHHIGTFPRSPEGAELSQDSKIMLDARGPLLIIYGGGPCLQEAVESILAGLDPAFRRFVAVALRRGLKHILPSDYAITDHRSCPTWKGAQDTHRENILDKVLEQTKSNLSQAVMPGDDAHTFAIRRHACEEDLFWFRYKRRADDTVVPYAPNNIPESWTSIAHLALKTGFLQLAPLQDGTLILCVPCHLGGFPWLVLCRVLANDPTGRWQAYSIYRDVIPRINDVLRLLGQESYAKEMERLFRVVDAGADGDFSAVIERVNAIWKHLACVYPLPRPYLVPATSTTQKTGSLGLPLRAGMAEVAFADEPTPCVSAATRLAYESGGAYAKVSPRKIRDSFVTPVLARVQEARSREASLLAEARKVALSHYGHTLKHRLDPLSAFLDANAPGAVRLRADMLKDLTLILQLNSVDDRPELCEKLPERKRKRFMDIEGVDGAPAELDLLTRIHEWAQVLTREEYVPVKNASGQIEEHIHCPVGLKLLDRISSVSVGWQMTSMGQNTRLKEPVFRELLFELLNNAWKYGDRRLRTVDGKAQVQISVWLDTVPMIVDGETRPLLVLANVIQPAKVDDCPLIAQSWTRWPDKGDIRYNGPGMALDLFRRLHLGDMYYRTHTRKGKVYLEVGISFAALAVTAGVVKEQAND